jgi:hypothetical protein
LLVIRLYKRRFVETWTLKYPWCLQDPLGTGNFEKVKCIVCSRVNGYDLLLDAKDDNLCKHQGWTIAKRDRPSLGKKKGDSWWNYDSKHKKAERVFAALPTNNIQTIVAQGAPPKRKESQMAVIFHMLSFGRPMVEYKHMRRLLNHLEVPKLPFKHWCDNSGWELAESLYRVVRDRTRACIGGGQFISISYDKVTTCNNQSWISIHAYILCDWERVP